MKRRILHIYARTNPASEQYSQKIDELQWEQLAMPDCYAALAELVLVQDRGFDAVVVWLNGLAPAEREFFLLVSRRYGETPVFVYGDSPQGVRVDEALTAGARRAILASQLPGVLDPDSGDEAEDDRSRLGKQGAAAPGSDERSGHVTGAARPPRSGTTQDDGESNALLSDEELQALLGEEDEVRRRHSLD